MAEERSVSDVLQDILRNLQDMVRSEIRLAKVEIREEVRRAVSSGVWIGAGTVGAVSAWIFLLWTLAYALATRMPMWAATLAVARRDGRCRRRADHGWHSDRPNAFSPFLNGRWNRSRRISNG